MSERPAEPAFDDEARAAIRRGVEEFNTGRFFECHDTIEDVWQGTRGPARDFLQGLIQISVGFYHLRNGNLTGARSQLEKGLANLESYGDAYGGIELRELRPAVGSWLEKIRRGEPIRGTLADVPKYRFVGD